MIALFALFVILLMILIWITHTPVRELFADTEMTLDKGSVAAVAKMLDIKEGEYVDPHVVFGKLRGLIDKYDNPEFTKHIQSISGLDPGQLARLTL